MARPDGTRIYPYTCVLCNATHVPGRPLKRCGGCQLVAYCGRDCQKQDRKSHKVLCEEFPVVNGLNVLHTTGSWEEHLANLRQRLVKLPKSHLKNDVFRDPKVCYTCRESRPDRLSMCKCTVLFYCSKKCTQADKWHTKACKALSDYAEHLSMEHMRGSYPLTCWYAVEKIYNFHHLGKYRSKKDISRLEFHVLTNTAYFDTQAWEIFFHQDSMPNVRHLNIIFITQDMEAIPEMTHIEKLTQKKCKVCGIQEDEKKKINNHLITSTVHQKPYHMFFSSPDYSEPDVVLVYGITGFCKDIHSEISLCNMTYSENSVLIVTDSTEDLLAQGCQAVNAARPVEKIVPPIINRLRFYGSNKCEEEFDSSATNEKYYLACLRKK